MAASVSASIARIDAALRRIEQAWANALPAGAPDPDLAARHEVLRTAAQEAIVVLDAVIAGDRGDG